MQDFAAIRWVVRRCLKTLWFCDQQRGCNSAADICQLMRDVSDKVQAQFGVVLEPEVKMIGEF